jgi:hypothetical protein
MEAKGLAVPSAAAKDDRSSLHTYLPFGDGISLSESSS